LSLAGVGADVAADVAGAGALLGFEPRVRAVDALEDASGSDVVVLTELDDGVAQEIAARCPDAIVVVATPDVAAHCAAVLDVTRFTRQRVIGVDGLPARAAARAAEAQLQGVSVRDVHGSGDGAAAGPLTTAAAVRAIVDAIVLDRRRVLLCAVYCHGEHDTEGVATVPVVIGRQGVEEIR
jgi:malate/lactate dehydrogenase